MVNRGTMIIGATVLVAAAAVGGYLVYTEMIVKKFNVTVTPSSIARGGTVLLKVSGATPNGHLNIAITTQIAGAGTWTATGTADASGNYSLSLVVQLSAGLQLVQVTDTATGKTTTTTFTVS